MNIQSYQKPVPIVAILRSSNQDFNNNSINLRGYLTRATIFALGMGGIILLSRKTNLSEHVKLWFYVLREYFPRGKNEDERSSPTSGKNNELCPICLGTPKTGVRAPCGHSICANCLTRYCEVRRTAEPPCPLCRAPVKSVTLATDDSKDLKPVGPNSSDSIISEMKTQNFENNRDQDTNNDKKIHCTRVSDAFASLYDLRDDYLTKNFITWIFVIILLFSVKFKILPSCDFFNGYETIFNFIISMIAVLTPIVYSFLIMCQRDELQLTISKP